MKFFKLSGRRLQAFQTRQPLNSVVSIRASELDDVNVLYNWYSTWYSGTLYIMPYATVSSSLGLAVDFGFSLYLFVDSILFILFYFRRLVLIRFGDSEKEHRFLPCDRRHRRKVPSDGAKLYMLSEGAVQEKVRLQV